VDRRLHDGVHPLTGAARVTDAHRLRAVLNPLRSEREAFRFLLYVVALCAAVIAIVLLVRAIT